MAILNAYAPNQRGIACAKQKLKALKEEQKSEHFHMLLTATNRIRQKISAFQKDLAHIGKTLFSATQYVHSFHRIGIKRDHRPCI